LVHGSGGPGARQGSPGRRAVRASMMNGSG
jgi:hypothetical protein